MVLTHIPVDTDSTESHLMRLIKYLKRHTSIEAFIASIPPPSSQHEHSNDAHEKQAQVDDIHTNGEDKQEQKPISTSDQAGSTDAREKPGDGEDTSEEEASDDDTQANGEDVHQQLRSNYQRAVEVYRNVQTCKPNILVDEYKIPQWLATMYHSGECNLRHFLQAWLLGYQLPASSTTSKLLRQYAYSILGVGVSGATSVCEYPISSGKVNEVRVEAVDSIQGSPSQRLPRISEVEGLSLTDRTRLLYQMLDCDQKKIETLKDEWRLVIASVVFWAREEQPSQALVEALLVCFLLCSGPSTKWLHFLALSADRWLETQSAFIAWQCTYQDSIGLNELLMKPLKSPSAAFLFDGKLAIGLAAETNIDDRVTEFGINRDLYKRLRDAVTSQYEALAAWKTVRESKPKAKPQPHSRRAGPEPQSWTRATQPQGWTGAAQPQGWTGATQPQGRTGAVQPQGRTGATQPQGWNRTTYPQGRIGAAQPQGRTTAT